jgi:hypothetical protein
MIKLFVEEGASSDAAHLGFENPRLLFLAADCQDSW